MAEHEGMAGIEDDKKRALEALESVLHILVRYTPGQVASQQKGRKGPVTAADHEVDVALRKFLPREGDAWLSEETVDDPVRLDSKRVWVVDAIDGTLEFVMGVPEWAVSISLIDSGRPVLGLVCNPATGEVFLATSGAASYNGVGCSVQKRDLAGSTVLASRSEIRRGEWQRFRRAPFAYQPMGSIAYKLALVAAGKFAATFTLTPKNEWDIAGGVALVEAAGGVVVDPAGRPFSFNRRDTLLPGLVAGSPEVVDELVSYLRTA